MPPATILEVLRILKAEVDLRELTRVAEQQKSAQPEETHAARAVELAGTQREIRFRTSQVIEDLEELARRESKSFPRELAQLRAAEAAMADARTILARPDTGAPAIAAETEAIEALLATRRGGGGGGGGGSSPGGSTSGGRTDLAAVALIGTGLGEKPESRVVEQASGSAAGSNIPEEYRAALDAYFTAFEGGSD